MVIYRFEKLYTDFVTCDGTVCIVYLAWTEILGVRCGTAGLELYTPDGRREVVHAAAAPPLPDLGAGSWTVRLDVPGGPFELRHAVRSGPWAPTGDDDRRDLAWSVKVACADVEAKWLGDPSRPVLSGLGYADWVVLSKPTRSFGLRRVDWGRAHVDGATWVWNRIRFNRGGWTRAMISEGRCRAEWHAVCIDEHDAGAQVTLPGGRELQLDGGRTLHNGAALDRERFPSALVFAAARLLSPRMHETRWVRRAHVSGASAEGWALHERVCFGGA